MPLSDDNELDIAWRALDKQKSQFSWHTISIRQPDKFSSYAGRHYPLNMESIIIGFPRLSSIQEIYLPASKGFDLFYSTKTDIQLNEPAIILVRKDWAPLELFKYMSIDILSLLDKKKSISEIQMLSTLIDRIKTWQNFMESPHGGPMSLERQTGLYGELYFIQKLIELSKSTQRIIESWDGPFRGAQDFIFDNIGFEVKTTTSPAGFNAKIQSLEQLDSQSLKNLYLMALRLVEDSNGINLVYLIDTIRETLKNQGGLREFNIKLSISGYNDEHADSYQRPLKESQFTIFQVDNNFPRLIPGNVPAQIRRARYEIELDTIGLDTNSNLILDEILKDY